MAQQAEATGYEEEVMLWLPELQAQGLEELATEFGLDVPEAVKGRKLGYINLS